MEKYEKEYELLEDMRQCYSLLFITLNKLQADIDANLACDLTSRQLMVLTAVAHCSPTDASIVHIADILGTTKQNVTRLVKTLCEKNYLLREPDACDRRSINIHLTEKGTRSISENIPKGNAFFLKIFKDFSPAEITAFRSALEKVSDYDHCHQKHLEDAIKGNFPINTKKMQPILDELHQKINS